MARLPRLAIDQQLHHLEHRAAPGAVLCDTDTDRSDFLAMLLAAAQESEVAIHAYALLPDRVQLLLTPQAGASLAPMMQRLGRRHVARYNKRHGRSGSPWAGRYRTSVLQASLYLIDAMRNVEMAPVLAGLVSRPEDWPASSAAHHFGLRCDPLVVDHPLYWALGNTPFERELCYRKLCEKAFPAAVATRIDEATDKGWALGDPAFIEQLSTQQARRLLPTRRGRPKRKPSLAESVSDPN